MHLFDGLLWILLWKAGNPREPIWMLLNHLSDKIVDGLGALQGQLRCQHTGTGNVRAENGDVNSLGVHVFDLFIDIIAGQMLCSTGGSLTKVMTMPLGSLAIRGD